jgi:hypothetical protein
VPVRTSRKSHFGSIALRAALLSECALKVFSRRNPSNLSTRFVFDLLLLQAFLKASHFELFGLQSVMRSIPTKENPIEGSMRVGRHIRRNGR